VLAVLAGGSSFLSVHGVRQSLENGSIGSV